MAANSRRVYSTHPTEQSDTPAPDGPSVKPPNQQTLYIMRDRKRRKGKTVTVISQFQGDMTAMKKELQKHCGAGGSVKNGEIEIQGDHRDKIAAYMRSKGYKVKLSGG
ncbi:MAG: translation initiation factor [Calditrichaeota bacterium]|nr:MAG: translation initiation factor [Calditrichota bacterium]